MNLDFQNVRKKLDFSMYYNLDEFLIIDSVIQKIIKKMVINNRYTIIVRVCYINKNIGSHKEYKMLGEQYGVSYKSEKDLYSFLIDFHDSIIDRLIKSMDDYNYKGYDVVNIQILGFILGEKKKVNNITFNTKSINEHKDLFNISALNKEFKIVPLNPNIKDFGCKLDKTYIDNNIYVSINNKSINIIEHLNASKVKNILSYSNTMEFYIKSYDNSDYIIVVNSINNIKDIYIYKISGMFIEKISIEYLDNNNCIRNNGNIKLYVNSKGVYKKDIIVPLSKVYANDLKGRLKTLTDPDWKIGTLDIETYNCNDFSYTYAIGFYIRKNNDVNTFYINNDMDSDKLILECIDKMLTSKYDGYTFYVHNLSGYDVYYLYKVIKGLPEKYSVKETFRDTDIIRLSISSINKSEKSKKIKNYTINIVDSYTMLQYSLFDLSKYFGNNVKKSFFPYSFVGKNTLLYKGDKPDKGYYSVKEEHMDEFNEFYYEIASKDWSVKDETIKYLEKDLISLFEIMETFIENVYKEYHVHVTNSLTISSLSMNIFLKRYYDNNIPLINNKTLYNNIKNSYYGGITEVYKPYGENLYYYDVNSLYPYAALNSMPGLSCTYSEDINKNIYELINDLFGFYYCKIDAREGYIGLLPCRFNSGLNMPLGSFEGWYFSEELKFAYENGYNIHVIKGYKFDKVDNVFSKYVNTLYNIKANTNDKVEKTIVKSLLNNLIGRFGLDINKYVTKIVTDEEFRYISETREIKNFKQIDDNYLVVYNPEISKKMCEINDLNYFAEVLNSSNSNINKQSNHNNVSIAIASAVTSYARIYINKIKLDILSKGGTIYYTDTDSIVTNIKLDSSIVGKDIGQLKLEHEIKEGYFLSSKTYGLITKAIDKKTLKNIIVLKNKGSNTKLDISNFIDVYNGASINIGKNVTKKYISDGYVIIGKREPFIMGPNSYTKRVKVFDSNNKWIDTKPIQVHSRNFHTNYKNNISFIVKTINMFIYNTFNVILPKCINNVKYYINNVIYYINNIIYYYGVIDRYKINIFKVVNRFVNILVNILLLIVVILLILMICYTSEDCDNSKITVELLAEVLDNNKLETNKSIFKEFFDSYINLFKKEDIGCIIHKDYDIYVKKDSDVINIVSNIKDTITENYIIQLEDKVNILEKKVSLLKMECLNSRINTLNLRHDLRDLVRDMSNIHNIDVNSPDIKLATPGFNIDTPMLNTPKIGLGLNIFQSK